MIDIGAGVEAILRASTPSSGALLGSNGPIGSMAVIGTTTNDSAPAGYLGEIIEASLAGASASSLTTATPKNILTLSLTAGDWDVAGVGWYTGGATTSVTLLSSAISLISGTLPLPGKIDQNRAVFPGGSVLFNIQDVSQGIGPVRVSLAATANVYLVCYGQFTVSTCSAYGHIRARRMR